MEHKYNIKSGVFGITGQEISIQLQNVLNCIKFLVEYPSFQHKQTYELYFVYNQNKDQVYNEMYTRDWW